MIIKQIIREEKREDVFNLEVDETHDFVIQGGVISHNCSDESRYMCMARPIAPRKRVDRGAYENSVLSQVFEIPEDELTSVRPKEKIKINYGGN